MKILKQKDILIVPERAVFENAHLAKRAELLKNPCLELFTNAWVYTVDTREEIIYITYKLREYLTNTNFLSEQRKRNALFGNVIRTSYENFDCEADESQIKLASHLSITTDKNIFFVTDNNALKDVLNKRPLFKVVSSKEAADMIVKD